MADASDEGPEAHAGPDGATRDAVVAEAVGALKRFSMLPDVTLRIVDLVNSNESSAQELHKVVSTDPALCVRILKVANSAFYGLRQPVTSVERAVTLLGGEAIKTIALAASFGRLIRVHGQGSSSPARDLWLHSLAVAAGARAIAQAAALEDAEEVFLAGLLHDIGFIVQLQHRPDGFAELLRLRAAGEHPGLDIEDDVFGANHQDFGRGLCESWHLPQTFGRVIGSHHDPLALEGRARAVASAVYLADLLAAQGSLGFMPGTPAGPGSAAAAAALGLAEAALEPLAAALPAMTRELHAVLGEQSAGAENLSGGS
ncbi:MAG TPA: HDOD domain-containing protein [Gammaproteobacteria bacterium]